jgi:hypothetical protein
MTDTINQMKTPAEHEQAGRDLVVTRNLVKLRNRLGFTRTAMAELLDLSPITYYRCEDQPLIGHRIWRTTAVRLGRFAYLAEITLRELEYMGTPIQALTPLRQVAVETGWTQEVLFNWYREEKITCWDLGILGLWVHDEDLHLISNAGA